MAINHILFGWRSLTLSMISKTKDLLKILRFDSHVITKHQCFRDRKLLIQTQQQDYPPKQWKKNEKFAFQVEMKHLLTQFLFCIEHTHKICNMKMN